MKRIYIFGLILLFSATFVVAQNKSSIKTFKGYFQKIEIGDRGIYLIFKDLKGEERSFRQDPYNSIGYFLVAHKNQLVTISYKIRIDLVPNADDGWKINLKVEAEEFVSVSIGKLTNSIWWANTRNQAIKNAKGNKAKVLQKLENDYKKLVDKSAE